MRPLLAIAIAAIMAVPAGAQEFAVTPGLYDYNSVLTINGQVALDGDYEYCLDDELSTMTLPEAIAELTQGAACDISNIQIGTGIASADITCNYPEQGITSSGTLRAVFDDTSYEVNTRGQINGSPAVLASQVVARRRGDCPAGWTPPPGISAD
jgi:hypothetical protein